MFQFIIDHRIGFVCLGLIAVIVLGFFHYQKLKNRHAKTEIIEVTVVSMDKTSSSVCLDPKGLEAIPSEYVILAKTKDGEELTLDDIDANTYRGICVDTTVKVEKTTYGSFDSPEYHLIT